MLTVGIIGAGRIGRVHAENLSKMRGVCIKNVSDINTEAIRPWAQEIGIEHVTHSYEEILHDREIKVIFICSPTKNHVNLIKEAAKEGKHIFCEKPISLNIQESIDALTAVKEHGVHLQVGFNRRFDPHFQRAHDIVRNQDIGNVHIVKITSRDPEPPTPEYIRTSGGLFIDMAIHDFDMARYIVGSEVEEVYAQGNVFIEPLCKELGDVDTAITTLKFINGAMAVIDNSRKAVYGYDQRLEVFGSKGCITIENARPTTAALSVEEGVMIDKPRYFFLERYQEAYVKEIEVFIRAIHMNEEPPVTGKDGLEAERIAHAAKRSLLEQHPIQMAKKEMDCFITQ